MDEQSSYKRTRQLLNKIRSKIRKLKKRNRYLEEQNERLKDKLEIMRMGQTDLFSSLSEKERLAYRHQIKSLINRIDKHLGDEP